MEGVQYCRDINELCSHLRIEQRSPVVYAVPSYLSAAEATEAKDAFAANTWSNGSSIYASSATPLYEYRDGSARDLDTYLADAESVWHRHAAVLGNAGDPVARMLEEMASGLEEPVRRLTLRDRPCFFGQFRCFADEDIEPHVDMIEREFPDLVGRPLFQWAVNVMLEQPTAGGELSLWNRVPDLEQYRGYGLARPPSAPAIQFRPRVGDLYFFPPRFVHAIAPSEGSRCTLAGFLAGWPDQGIRVWS